MIVLMLRCSSVVLIHPRVREMQLHTWRAELLKSWLFVHAYVTSGMPTIPAAVIAVPVPKVVLFAVSTEGFVV